MNTEYYLKPFFYLIGIKTVKRQVNKIEKSFDHNDNSSQGQLAQNIGFSKLFNPVFNPLFKHRSKYVVLF